MVGPGRRPGGRRRRRGEGDLVGGVGAETLDVGGQVRREGGEVLGGDGPALGGQVADDRGHVHGGVEDHAVGQEGGELDDLLLLVGVVVGDDPAVAEPAPGHELVVGLDLVGRRAGPRSQSRVGQVAQQRHGADDPADLAEGPVEVVAPGVGRQPAHQRHAGDLPGLDGQDHPHQVLVMGLDEVPVDNVAPRLAEQRVDMPVHHVGRRAVEVQVPPVTDPRHQVEPEQMRQSEDRERLALGVGVRRLGPQLGLLLEQPVDQVDGLPHPARMNFENRAM